MLYQRRPGNNGRVIAPHDVAFMNTMMTETLLTGTARKGQLDGWQAAGKTGTSQDYRDAWFVGYGSPRRRRLARQRRFLADQESVGRHAAGRDLVALHEDGAGRRAADAAALRHRARRAGARAVIRARDRPAVELFGIPLPHIGQDAPVAQGPRPSGRVHDAYDEMNPPRPPQALPRERAERGAPLDDGPPDNAPSRRAEAGHDRSLVEKLFGSPL